MEAEALRSSSQVWGDTPCPLSYCLHFMNFVLRPAQNDDSAEALTAVNCPVYCRMISFWHPTTAPTQETNSGHGRSPTRTLVPCLLCWWKCFPQMLPLTERPSTKSSLRWFSWERREQKLPQAEGETRLNCRALGETSTQKVSSIWCKVANF